MSLYLEKKPFLYYILGLCGTLVYHECTYNEDLKNIFFGNNYYNVSLCLEGKNIGHGRVNDITSLEMVRSC